MHIERKPMNLEIKPKYFVFKQVLQFWITGYFQPSAIFYFGCYCPII